VDILKLSRTDVLDYTEKQGFTAEQSFPTFIAFNELKREILKEHKDTYFGMSFNDFIYLSLDIGFNVVYNIGFDHDGRKEKQVLLWDGSCIINCSSYKEHLNDANLYFNWAKTKNNDFYPYASGGTDNNFMFDKVTKKVLLIPAEYRYDTKIALIRSTPHSEYRQVSEAFERKEKQWRIENNLYPITCGDLDIREAFVANLNEMKKNGVFISPWVNLDHLNLRHYGEIRKDIPINDDFCNQYLIDKLSKIGKLPQEVSFKILYYS